MDERAAGRTHRRAGPRLLPPWPAAAMRVARLEADLAAVRDRFTVIAASLPDGFVLVDLTGRIQYANDAAGEMFGARPDDLLGRVFRDLMEAGSLVEGDSFLLAADHERVGPFELGVDPAGMAARVVSVTAGPWASSSGDRLGTWAHLHDATMELAEQQQVMSQQETLIMA